MIAWVVRLLLALAGAVAGMFVADDSENFTVVQGMVAVAIFAVVVLGFALADRRE